VVRAGLPARTPQTITDGDMLRRLLDEESEIGMRCIAAPVRNDGGEVVAAIGIAGPVSRLTRKALTAFIPHVIEIAAAISARLGHRPRIAS
jgi:DNA-binding IclR family transcriptional regulator